MSYCTKEIKALSHKVEAALKALDEQVRNDIPAGTLVEYKHGLRWVGPCELTSWAGAWWNGVNGPDAMLKNLKTQKVVRIGSYDRIRPYQGDVA